jgi:hypothetical protein
VLFAASSAPVVVKRRAVKTSILLKTTRIYKHTYTVAKTLNNTENERSQEGE